MKYIRCPACDCAYGIECVPEYIKRSKNYEDEERSSYICPICGEEVVSKLFNSDEDTMLIHQTFKDDDKKKFEEIETCLCVASNISEHRKCKAYLDAKRKSLLKYLEER